jgi:hypothetical protein
MGYGSGHLLLAKETGKKANIKGGEPNLKSKSRPERHSVLMFCDRIRANWIYDLQLQFSG